MGRICDVASTNLPPQPSREDDAPSPTGFLLFESPVTVNEGQLLGFTWASVTRNGASAFVVFCLRRPYEDEAVPGDPSYLPLGLVVIPKDSISSDDAGYVRVRSLIEATWGLMEQRIASTSRMSWPRSLRRHGGAPDLGQGISIIRLRREQSPSALDKAEGHVDGRWRCRWLVSGHWANHWFPKKKVNRYIWKGGYVKGPVDKPLRVTTRVHALVR
jgi:hypothetical protein